MSEMRIAAPRLERHGAVDVLSAAVSVDGREWNLWYETEQGPVTSGVEPFLAMAVIPAMSARAQVRVETPVSGQLLDGLQGVQSLFAGWDPLLSMVPVTADVRPPAEAADGQRRVASVFSGGVDSFFTLRRHLDEITDIIFVQGFDITLQQRWLYDRASLLYAEVARTLGKRLVRVRTNIRELGNPYVHWGRHFHGSAIASIAHLLAPQFAKVYVAGEFMHHAPQGRVSRAIGSNRESDPLFSSDSVEIVHDGFEYPRIEKVREIGGWEPVHGALRVCWEQRRGAYNCCECSKCMRNMAMLQAFGQLDNVLTFDQPLNLDLLASLRLFEREGLLRRRRLLGGHRVMVQHALEAVERNGSDPELVQAMRDCLAEVHYRGLRGARHDLWSFMARLRRIARGAARVARSPAARSRR